MTDLDPSELSALLDGELDELRAAQVEAIIASDEGLRTEYEILRQADAHWRSMARSAAFQTRGHWQNRATQILPTRLVAPLLFIPLASVAGRLTGAMAASLALNSLSLVILIVCVSAIVSSCDLAREPLSP